MCTFTKTRSMNMSYRDYELSPAAPPPRPKGSLEGMPKILKEQLLELETWAEENRKDARSDSIRFWVLKAPAILVSACGSVFAYFKLGVVSVIAGAVSGLCVLLDGLNPGGQLRNAHYKAFLELRKLQQDMQAQWRTAARS